VEYRDRASEAAGLAKASPLAHVREKHETAAVRWTELAELNERDGGVHAQNGPEAGPVAAAPPSSEDAPCTP
jgi:hypothetical protein